MKATAKNYYYKRKYRHEHPDAQWDENGCLIVPEWSLVDGKPVKAKAEAEPEQKDGEEAEEGEGDDEDEESDELDSDVEECMKPAVDFLGIAPKDAFGEDIMKHMPRKMGGPGGKSTRIKFEFPKGATPEATPPGSDAEDEKDGEEGGGAPVVDDD